jgi:[protein-PII] uridylyltransferase
VDLRPDERGRYFLLSITANDRNGLLYAVANLLAKYKINLHTAKVMTLGERVEDVFIIDGAALQAPKTQISLKLNYLKHLKLIKQI